MYTPLHLHTIYSVLDGLIHPTQLIEKAKKYNIKSLGQCDHGNMYSALKFYRECKKNDINPILGTEIYICDNINKKEDRKMNHLVLMAKDYDGYKNLMKLVSISNIVGFYYRPRLDIETISKYSKGLIASSACLQGEICQGLLNNDFEGAKKIAATYKDIFKEDFYIEIMRSDLEDQKKIEADLLKISRQLSIKPIATSDAHYLNKEDSFIHEVALCIGTNDKIANSNRKLSFSSDEFYVRTPKEMAEVYKDIPETLKNTMEIAEKCNLNIESKGIRLVKYDLPKEKNDSFEYLKEKCRAGWKKYNINKADNRYVDRIKYELETINNIKLSDYFLIVADICEYADKNDIGRNFGRGSAAGSLVSYLLGITKVDPLKYGLIFERFYNQGRGKIKEINGEYFLEGAMPDIDCDFEFAKRDKILEYIKKKYKNMCQIVTFNTMTAKAALKDTARVLNMDFALSNKITSYVPKGQGMTLQEAIASSEELQKFAIQYKKLFIIAKKLEGNIRNASLHAAGIIISDRDLTENIPLGWDSKTKSVISGFDDEDCAEAGLQKIDILGLTCIDKIKKTIELIDEKI